MHTGHALATLTLAAAPLASPAPEDTLRYAPADGGPRTLAFSERSVLTLESMTQVYDGSEVQEPSPGMDGVFVRTLRVTDRDLEAEDGRPLHFVRSYDEVGSTMELDIEAADRSESYEGALETPVAGEEALWRWDGDAGEHRCRSADDEDPPEHFEGLREDLELRALLPEGEVGEGDSWKVSGPELLDVLRPGGDLFLGFAEPPEGPYQMLELPDVVAASMLAPSTCMQEGVSGELSAEWVETIDVDGRRMARVELELELELEGDFLEPTAARLERSGVGEARVFDSFDYLLELDGEGELLWDLEGGRFHALTLRSDVILEAAMAWTQSFGNVSAELEIDVELSGVTELEVRAE